VKRILKTTALATSALLALGGVSSASVLDPLEVSGCDIDNFEGSTSCRINIGDNPGGNVTATGMNASNFGDLLEIGESWQELDVFDTVEGGSGGTSEDELFSISYSSDESYFSGTWILNPLFQFDDDEHYAFAIKSASPNAQGVEVFNVVYLMNNDVTSGMFNTSDLTQGFSNIRLFGTGDLAPIPLPAAGWMLLAGVGGLFAMKRRKKADA
jgi:hypothetical protein